MPGKIIRGLIFTMRCRAAEAGEDVSEFCSALQTQGSCEESDQCEWRAEDATVTKHAAMSVSISCRSYALRLMLSADPMQIYGSLFDLGDQLLIVFSSPMFLL